jgi:hypothetical protein
MLLSHMEPVLYSWKGLIKIMWSEIWPILVLLSDTFSIAPYVVLNGGKVKVKLSLCLIN